MPKLKYLIIVVILAALLAVAGGFSSNLASAVNALAQLMGGDPPPLGTVESFAVLAGSTATNTGSTVVNGNLGVWPGTAVTGFPPGIVNGTIYAGDAVAEQAQSDLTIAYNDLAGRACDVDLTGQDLGGLTLGPAVYCFSESAQLTGQLTLDAQGNPAAVFIFQIGSTLTTATNSSVLVSNSGSECNAYWQVGSSATLGTSTGFAGNILALTSITLNTSANVTGRVLARNGAVTMDTNNISLCAVPGPTETPTLAATDTPIPTATVTPIPTATDTPIPTATDTPIPTATDTPIPTATVTLIPTATVTQEPTPTETPTLNPTATGTQEMKPTETPTLIPTATGTQVPTPTETPTSPTPTITPLTPTPIITPPTPIITPPTPIITPPTPIITPPTPTVTPPTPTVTPPTPTVTPPTPTVTPPTPTVTPPTPTATPPTPTVTPPTPAPTATPPTPAPTPAPTATPTPAPVVGLPDTGGGALLKGDGLFALNPSLLAQIADQGFDLQDPITDSRERMEDTPFELQIPSLQVTVPVVGVGLTSANVMDAPRGSPADPVWQTAFWYRDSSIPGSRGTATLAGHVTDLLGQPGAFARLKDLRPGDLIVVHDTQSGLDVHFMVTRMGTYSAEQSADPSLLEQVYGNGQGQPSSNGRAYLTLITCTGEYVDGSFVDRLVVYAQQVVEGLPEQQ